MERIQGNLTYEQKIWFNNLLNWLFQIESLLLQTKHSKNYNETVDGGKQDKMRQQVFLNKDAKIKKHNSGNATYKQALNKLSDRVFK